MATYEEDFTTALLSSVEKVTVLTGAGVSTASGIPDFATVDETWDYPFEREFVISHPFFEANPETFWPIYRNLFGLKASVAIQPNIIHEWIAGLETNKEVIVATQNVDGLHVKAGSSHVLEMHGNIHRSICIKCKAVFDNSFGVTDEVPYCDRTGCNGLVKPDVVLFEEMPKHIEEAVRHASESGLLIIAGTRLQVNPVGLIPVLARQENPWLPIVSINRTSTPYDSIFDAVLRTSIETFVQQNPVESFV